MTARPVVVPEVTASAIFSGETLEVLLDAGVRAVCSIPLIGQAGRVLGVISVHYEKPTEPTPNVLRAMRYHALSAADVVSWCKREVIETQSPAATPQ